MFSFLWPLKNAEPAFAKWMDQSAQRPWTWAAFEVNSTYLGHRKLSLQNESESFGLELYPDHKLRLQALNRNLFHAKTHAAQARDFCNATQDTFFAWMAQTPREKLDQKIENLNHDFLEQEDRALMWLQTSFQVIEQALKECLEPQTDTALQARIFAGKAAHLQDPESFEWRVILFEVDFQLIFRRDAKLEVKVFRAARDPKKKSDAGPDLHAVFALRRREVYDLFVKQLNLIAKSAITR